MNDGKVNVTRYGPSTNFFVKIKNDLNSKAIELQRAQNNLSSTKYDFTPQNILTINPKNITLYYNTFEEVGVS